MSGEYKSIAERRVNETREALAKAFEGMGVGESKVMLVPHVSDNEALVVRCGGGYLVSYPTGGPGYYSEIGVDFVRDDGHAMQLTVVGRDEGDGGWPFGKPDGYQNMHLITYENGDEATETYIDTEDENDYYSYVY